MNRLYGKTYIAVYQTAGEKTRRALAKWHDDLVILGVRGECKGMPQMVLDAIVEEAANIGRTQEARSTAGRKGNAVRWSQEPSQNVSQTASQNVSQTHRTGTGTGTNNIERFTIPRGPAREERPPTEEATALGYAKFAPVAEELRRLVPNDIPLAAVFSAAEAGGFGPDELLQFANHYAGYNWRRGQGQGGMITRDTIGNVLAVWASRRSNFNNTQGASNGNSGTHRGGNRVFDPSRPIQTQRGNADDLGEIGF